MSTQTETLTRIEMPSLWSAVLINTPNLDYDFAFSILQSIFGLTADQSRAIVRTVANENREVVFTGTNEVVTQKIADTKKIADTYKKEIRLVKEKA